MKERTHHLGLLLLCVIKSCQVLAERQLMASTAREFVFLYPLPAQPSFHCDRPLIGRKIGALEEDPPHTQCNHRTRSEYSSDLFSKDLWSFTIHNYVLNMGVDLLRETKCGCFLGLFYPFPVSDLGNLNFSSCSFRRILCENLTFYVVKALPPNVW